MVSRLLASSRYLIIIAVAGSFVAALTLMIYSGVAVAWRTMETISASSISDKSAKSLALAFIELVDLFLLATVFYIIALGLYELFISDNLPLLPTWLEIHTLDDLKDKLAGVVIVVMAVLFLGQVVTWDGQRNLLGYGGAIALVIAALTYFLSQQKAKKDKA